MSFGSFLIFIIRIGVCGVNLWHIQMKVYKKHSSSVAEELSYLPSGNFATSSHRQCCKFLKNGLQQQYHLLFEK